MPDIEAIGDAATGAVLARTVEGVQAGPDGHTHERNCLNCGTELSGEFCHACGQRAHVHRTLTAFWHDLAHGVLHLDGKIWRTLPMLAWRPGDLTRRYAHGERARFVSPMALFLFSVFLMFAVFALLGPSVVNESTVQGTTAGRQEAEREMAEARRDAQAELKALQDERARIVAARAPTAEVDQKIRSKREEIAVQERLFRETLDFLPGGSRSPVEAAASSSGAEIDVPGGWFNKAYQKAKENPKLLLYKIQSNAYKFSWLLIPISIPLVWLLFLHRRRYRQFTAYDHTVFVTYSIAFMSLAAIVLTLLRWAGLPGGYALLAVLIVPPIHIYRQLKDAYGLARGSALWRTFALMLLSLIALGLFAALLLMVGVFG